MLARLVLRLVRCKPMAMVTFENPNHGSFKSNAVVQSLLRRPGWWMVAFDYCAMAREDYDGAILGPANRREGGLTALKTSVMVVYGIDDDPEEGLLRCAVKKCRMVVPGTKRHVLLICKPQGGFGTGQQKIEDGKRPIMPLGVYVHFLEKHFKWRQQCDGCAFYCYKCGKASGERQHLALCDTEGCNRVLETTKILNKRKF